MVDTEMRTAFYPEPFLLDWEEAALYLRSKHIRKPSWPGHVTVAEMDTINSN